MPLSVTCATRPSQRHSGCSTTMSGCRGSPSLRYTHWRLFSHCVGVHHLSGMHIGGCSSTVAVHHDPSLRYAHWRLLNHYVRVHHLSGTHISLMIRGCSTTMLGCTISGMHTGCCSATMSGFTISQVRTLEVAQPLCESSGAHHLSGMHTGGYLTIKSSRYAHWRLLNH